jgi:hypothetical protein
MVYLLYTSHQLTLVGQIAFDFTITYNAAIIPIFFNRAEAFSLVLLLRQYAPRVMVSTIAIYRSGAVAPVPDSVLINTVYEAT